MTNVEFQGELRAVDRFANTTSSARRAPFLSRLLIKSGIARDERRANVILVIIAIVCFLVSGVFWMKLSGLNFEATMQGNPETY